MSAPDADDRPTEPVPGAYRAPRAEATAELRERRSRFLAVLSPARDEAEATAALEALRRRHPDATHHCWAWRLGGAADERASDDGEPAGTAGQPILGVLRGAELSDVLGVVVRWYGGVKLGKGGLVRAYAEATRRALAELPTRLVVPSDELVLELPYERIGALKRLVQPPAIELVDERYGERVRLVLRIQRHQRGAFEDKLAELGLAAREIDGA